MTDHVKEIAGKLAAQAHAGLTFAEAREALLAAVVILLKQEHTLPHPHGSVE